MRIGIWFYGLSTAAFGMLDLVWRAFEPSHQPIQTLGSHIPGLQILACIAGLWMLAAGLAVLWPRTVRMGAAGSAIIYLVFALLWVPRFSTATHQFGLRIGVIIFVISGVAQQLLLASPAAIVYATNAPTDSIWREKAATIARWMLGLPPIIFGLMHLIGAHVMERFVPQWMPFKGLWAVLTGIAFFLAGSAICAGIRDVLAARLLALMLLLFEFMVEIPPVFAHPRSQGAWGGAVYNLVAVGACWIFAEFVGSRQTDRGKTGLAEHYATAHSDKSFATGS
jgi:uncharacterized membrane protein YphA (DoxX/SURF4 family)